MNKIKLVLLPIIGLLPTFLAASMQMVLSRHIEYIFLLVFVMNCVLIWGLKPKKKTEWRDYILLINVLPLSFLLMVGLVVPHVIGFFGCYLLAVFFGILGVFLINRKQYVVAFLGLCIIGTLVVWGSPTIIKLTNGREIEVNTSHILQQQINYDYVVEVSKSGKKVVDQTSARVKVLDFWATWCRPCIEAFPTLEKLHKKYQTNPDVNIIAFNIGGENETLPRINKLMEKNSLTFPVFLDTAAFNNKQLKINYIPFTVVTLNDKIVKIIENPNSHDHYFELVSQAVDSVLFSASY